MGVFDFLKSRSFFKHLCWMLASVLLGLILVYFFMHIYTRHGKEYVLPEVIGKTVEELSAVDSLRFYEWVVIDSVYQEGKMAGEILKQDPILGSKVKKGRKVYLTIAAMVPEEVLMPECAQQSLKAAVSQLVSLGLRVGTLYFVSGDVSYFVVAQKFEGKPIRKGKMVRMGSSIDLVVEMHAGTTSSSLPPIIGKTELEACRALWSVGMNIGKITYKGDREKDHQRVVNYTPTYGSATLGTTFDLFLMNDTEKRYNGEIKKFSPLTPIDTLSEDEDGVSWRDLF